MDDLIAFLRARLRDARWWSDYERLSMIVGDVVYPMCEPRHKSSPSPHVAYHIALHQPRRVLADVAAKREVVKLGEYLLETRKVQEDAGKLSDYSLGRAHTGGSVLRLLALPYADHPDYREEWKP